MLDSALASLLFFTLGAVCASFMGLVVARLYTGASVVGGRSVCDACGVALSPRALVPIFSWLLLWGRCLACRARVGVTSTITEITLGLLFVLAYLKFGLTLELVLVLGALTLLAGLVLYDGAHSILPPVLLWPFVLCAMCFAAIAAPNVESLALAGSTALLLGSLLALIHLASGGRAMGLADAPLTFGLSLLTGYPLAISGLLFSFWLGGVVGIILLAQRALGATISSEVPFAPYLAAGFLLTFFTQWDASTLISALLAPFTV